MEDERDNDPRYKSWRSMALGGVGAAFLAGGVLLGRRVAERKRMQHPHDDAPGRTARTSGFGDYDVVGKTVTVSRPRSELFAFWRDFQNLPKFMENLVAVDMTGETRAVWRLKAPARQIVDVETHIVQDIDNELIAWRSVDGSKIETEGRVSFRDAPGDRGTHVELILSWVQPGGEIGRLVGKLFRRDPEIQARHELKRFKMLMETGEIATSDRTKQNKEG